MTSVQAQSIVRDLSELEFPFLFRKSLQFALFKTYGIPTISSLLASTSLFSNPKTASKRYEDTTVLIGEFIAHRPDEQRTHKAIGRINSIHGPYIKAGKILNQDLLYTLSVFVTEPIVRINRWEWRQLTDMEVCAQGTFWKSIGDAMGIQYTGLLRRDSWRDGLEFVEDISAWAQQYETDFMVPAATNKQTSDELVRLLLYTVPSKARSFASHVIGVLMGERLRNAMIHPTPPPGVEKIVHLAFSFRAFLLRHFSLPRFLRKTEFSDMDPATGRYYHFEYLIHPYYVRPTFGSRWGPQAWLTWALGGIVPGGRDGSRYMPGGYRFEEVGPNNRRPFGKEKLEEWEGQVERTLPVGCPFARGC
ncbi:hypothetical protein E4U42_006813 [Claviceps africana]|uniref:ER-bound oxygenase mpaB/mpaB'/Rubber oxygenase catalytic domain-containing protein n=1 Tax=Claviceps africana TaxID=83212 RepID=A0A8K0NEU3_9HYPO|nr:hypothetical protein E4U42_006813 [Claviceps africana]